MNCVVRVLQNSDFHWTRELSFASKTLQNAGPGGTQFHGHKSLSYPHFRHAAQKGHFLCWCAIKHNTSSGWSQTTKRSQPTAKQQITSSKTPKPYQQTSKKNPTLLAFGPNQEQNRHFANAFQTTFIRCSDQQAETLSMTTNSEQSNISSKPHSPDRQRFRAIFRTMAIN
jgi:hypothetical protein